MVIAILKTEIGYFSGIFLRLLLFVLLFSLKNSKAQTLPVGISMSLEDFYRRTQLLGADSSNSSYLIRPIRAITESSNHTVLALLPVAWNQQYTTHHPYGMNDGLMVPANGYQTLFSAGMFFKYGPLSIQIRPELVFAENKDYRELHETSNGPGFQNAVASYLNRIDLPSRFGKGVYTRAAWGQSSIRLTFDPVSIGLSNENLWWGPGRYNALLMSNNAPGFKHLTLNTSKPIKTGIGFFEAQMIGARLDGSDVAKLEGDRFLEKPGDWRYLSGIVFTYQPKWLKGLSLGFDRTFMIYRKDMGNSFGEYFPLFSSLSKNNFNNEDNTVNSEDQLNRDQNFSLFARWTLTESRVEIYAQYGRTDFSWDLRDAVVEPEHSRAYIVGFRKLMALRAADEYIEAGIELTQMEGSNTGLLRDEPSWYVHTRVPAGYTQMGQIIGAGIGPESNMQTLELSWVKGLKRIGLVIDHLVHDYGLSRTVQGERKSWSDLAFTGRYDWTYKDFVLNSRLAIIRSANYLYENKENNPNNMVNNVNLQLGILYNL
jgi:hypothetical protein